MFDLSLRFYRSRLSASCRSIGRSFAGAAVAACLSGILSGCIRNDIPYPRIQPDFLEIDAEGLTQPAQIDKKSRFITMNFDETVDLQQVSITHYKLSEGASIVAGDLTRPINLEKYYIVTLSLYQDYDWVIQGIQNIERYFTVENQVGASIIDVAGQRVVVTVPAAVGLEHVHVLTMKLGPAGSTQTPALQDEIIDLSDPVEVVVNVHGREQIWTIHGETVVSTVRTERADAWTRVAWVYGAAIEGRENGVEYKVKGSDAWEVAPQEWITHTGATFRACLNGLQPLTTYVARAYSGTEKGIEVEFTTGSEVQVPNASFDYWNLAGKIWNPWGEGQTPYWDTGNKGATTLGDSNTFPTSDTSSGSGQAAQLETRFVGIGVVGKLAAGNIFAGSYVRTDGTNGVLSFGRAFTERPTRLRGYLKYTSTPISNTNNEFTYLKGEPDTCIVWTALIDSPEAFEIRTNPKNRQLFNPDGASVIAYGKFESGKSIPQYIPFEITIDYKATNRVPRYLLIVASSSKYGDYFTGGAGSTLWLDDLELLYDY